MMPFLSEELRRDLSNLGYTLSNDLTSAIFSLDESELTTASRFLRYASAALDEARKLKKAGLVSDEQLKTVTDSFDIALQTVIQAINNYASSLD
jgi:hypothetical protein